MTEALNDSLAAVQGAALPLETALQYNEAEAALPRVLLIGDSISFGYAEPVARQLRGHAQVFRLRGRTAATVGGSLVLNSRSGLANLDWWLEQRWDAMHFNWGLHDLKRDNQGNLAVPLDEYEANLSRLVEKLNASGARLIWASTTPVPDGKTGGNRRGGDEILYNAAAARVMNAAKVPTDDFYRVAQNAMDAAPTGEIKLAANVHFTQRGSRVLAPAVSCSIARYRLPKWENNVERLKE